MSSPVNTSLTCNSPKVWAFYKEHPELDFEKMNIMFTDIIASIMQSTNPVNNNNITTQIMNGIANIQAQLTSQQMEYSKLLFLKLTEFKKEYIDDLKIEINKIKKTLSRSLTKKKPSVKGKAIVKASKQKLVLKSRSKSLKSVKKK